MGKLPGRGPSAAATRFSPMDNIIHAWSAKEVARIARIALCVPEGLRGEYIAREMAETLAEFATQAGGTLDVTGRTVSRPAPPHGSEKINA